MATVFLQKIIHGTGGNIRFIHAEEDGKACWFYLKMYPEKRMEYKLKLRIGKMNIADYGDILKSGWGDYPSEDVVSYMKKEFGFDTPKME